LRNNLQKKNKKAHKVRNKIVFRWSARYRCSRSFRHGFTTFCTDTHRARWQLVRVQLRVWTQMKGRGRCFPKRRIGGGQRVNRGSLCARAARHAPLTLAWFTWSAVAY